MNSRVQIVLNYQSCAYWGWRGYYLSRDWECEPIKITCEYKLETHAWSKCLMDKLREHKHLLATKRGQCVETQVFFRDKRGQYVYQGDISIFW